MANLQILKLGELKKHHQQLVGSKAYRLGLLMQAGFNVPGGFVIPYTISDRLKNISYHDWPQELANAIKHQLALLLTKNAKVAVRSSALIEDSATLSYAGQFKTVLNVSTVEQGLAAIETVIASSKAEHIAIYHDHFADQGIFQKIAVIVQVMVDGDYAGVIFTQNLIQNRLNEILIEVSQKQHDAVVSGTALSEQLTLNRDDFAIEQHTIQKTALITGQAAKQIGKEALAIEEYFKEPSDIEFCYVDGKVFVLQARPITTIQATYAKQQDEFAPHSDGNVIWTSHNVQEAFPKVMTPYSISIWLTFMNPALNRHHNQLRIKSKRTTTWLFGFFYYQIYANVSLARLESDRILGQDPNRVMRSYLGKTLPYPDRESWWKRWLYRIYSAPFINYHILRLPKIISQLNDVVMKKWVWLNDENLEGYSNQQLIDLHKKLTESLSANALGYHITIFTLPTLAVRLLEGIVSPIFKDNTESIINRLLSGLSDVESAHITDEIWNLSRIANKYQLEINDKFNPLSNDLPKEWLFAYQTFINHHGHRGLHELVFEAPLWRDNPAPLLLMISQQMKLSDEQSPQAANVKAKKSRLSLTKDICEKLHFFKRIFFRLVLNKAWQWTALREMSKSTEAKAIRLLDPIVSEMKKRLMQKQALANESDFWYLTYQEVVDILLDNKIENLQKVIIMRKKTMTMNQFVHLPDYFYGYPTPTKPEAIDAATTVLKGVAVNSGVVTGKARVLTDLNRSNELQAGEILVTHISDAAWTPLYTLAAGVVVDIGSLLSHSSIIAREFGLPAIINVESATSVIHTGDLITVDGNRGVVMVLKTTPSE